MEFRDCLRTVGAHALCLAAGKALQAASTDDKKSAGLTQASVRLGNSQAL